MRHADPYDYPLFRHPLDRLIARVLEEEDSDQIGAPAWAPIAEIVVDRFFAALAKAGRRGRPIDPDAAELGRKEREAVRKTCMARIDVMMH